MHSNPAELLLPARRQSWYPEIIHRLYADLRGCAVVLRIAQIFIIELSNVVHKKPHFVICYES